MTLHASVEKPINGSCITNSLKNLKNVTDVRESQFFNERYGTCYDIKFANSEFAHKTDIPERDWEYFAHGTICIESSVDQHALVGHTGWLGSPNFAVDSVVEHEMKQAINTIRRECDSSLNYKKIAIQCAYVAGLSSEKRCPSDRN